MTTDATITFDPALPISAHVDEIARLITDHQVVIVEGETGSGKTTQLPKICLALGRTRIGHTQPRRIAARTVSARIADELGVELGTLVGYQVRFTRETSRQTQLKVMTDGVLLAEIAHDRDLRRYDTIIIDEAHERSLNIDFLLGYLKRLCRKRSDLKVIITSATIDTARFSEHFNDAPVISVSGRTYPVEVRYRPFDDEADQPEAIVLAAHELIDEGPGDILVFLSGEREIREATEALAAEKLPDVEIVPLFARLSMAEQRRVFTPHAGRRIVLATNVAETSLTVPGIRYVIDTGLARISRYSARTKVQRLPIEPISQASANQRAGRCGRLGPGICVRLYGEDDYLTRPAFTEPEILRTNLASVILQMAAARLGAISDFDFVEPPDQANITDGMRLLEELGALAPGSRHQLKLTPVGHQLARIPVDPRLARMLVAAAGLGCLREVQVLVAGMSVQDVRERPVEHRADADAMHKRFHSDDLEASASAPDQPPARHTPHTNTRITRDEPKPDPGGDFAAMLRLWRCLEGKRRELSSNQFRKLCRAEFINYLRVREWQDLHGQLRQICRDLDLERNRNAAPFDHVLIAILSGLLSHVGLADVDDKPAPRTKGRKPRRGPREYLGARGAKFAINPGSALATAPPPLVMAMELVETTRLWARTVAAIDATWIEQVGAHLLKSTYSEPHFSTSSGSVLAYQRMTLYGIPIIADRLVNYARVNAGVAREIFIRSALVDELWRPRPKTPAATLFDHNRSVREELEQLEERSRRRDLVVDEHVLYEFFNARLPEHVNSSSALDKWLRAPGNAAKLRLDTETLRRDDASHVGPGAFPDVWAVGDLELPVSYIFDPGSGADGVTVTIELAQLNQVRPEPFTWQVPGLRAELATELIRSLPKAVRTQFVPAPDHARSALAWLAENDADHTQAFTAELGRALHAITGEIVAPDQWQGEAVPAHLRVGFQIVDRGKPVSRGDDLGKLREQLRPKLAQKLTQATSKGRQGTTWVFGTMRPSVQVGTGERALIGYPGLADEGTHVREMVFDTAQAAARSHRAALIRLIVLNTPDPTRWAISHLTNHDKLALGTSPYPDSAALFADARLKAVAQLVDAHGDPAQVRSEKAFDALLLHVRQEQADQVRTVVSTAAAALRANESTRRALDQAPDLRAELTGQLDNLIFERFISFTRDPWFGHLARYIAAIEARVRAYLANPARDDQAARAVDEVEDRYLDLLDRLPAGPVPDEVDDIGFAIEEFRVQQFAQHLRTSMPVSTSRIAKMITSAEGNLANR